MTTEKLKVKVGKLFLIQLPGNRTTGYRWEADYDGALMGLSTSKYERFSEEAGSGGLETFRFMPCKKGRTVIRMVYKRPWEKTNAKELLYDVVVEE